jgi:hypothetical protein
MVMRLNEEISRIKTVMGLNEKVETKGVQMDSSDKKIIDDFVEFIKKELGIEYDVNIILQNNKDGIKTTAVYRYQDEGDENFEQSEIRVFVLDRALVDILRSIAHEMTHHRQNEDGDLKGKISNVGGPIEDDANATAGELIKKFGIQHPEIYGEESKEEVGEQEDGGAPATASMSKWETGLRRGPANMIEPTSKWESGVSRGKANPLW